MNNEYVCPYCRGHLKVKNSVILAGRKENGERGLILLSPQLGDYTIRRHRSFTLNEGEKTDIYCPICHANLMAQKYNNNLARLIAIDGNGRESEILISEVVGERCTYIVRGEKIDSYGDDSTNYFGASSDM